MPNELQPLTFALGGGGVKSVAAAGVLAVMEEAGLPIGPVVGVSGGGLVALLYGAGCTPLQIRDYFREIELAEVWEPDPERQALFGASRIRARLAQLVGEKTFADLTRPAIAMAMDLHTEKPVRLDSGLLVDALAATMAIPGLFRGVRRDDQLLVDCGPVMPIPVSVARDLGPRLVAVDVLHHRSPEEYDHLFASQGPMRYAAILTRRLGMSEIINYSYHTLSIMTRNLSAYLLALYPPDVLIRPEVGRAGLFAFDLADYVYEKGREAAVEALPQLEALARPRPPSLWRRLVVRGRNLWNRRPGQRQARKS